MTVPTSSASLPMVAGQHLEVLVKLGQATLGPFRLGDALHP